MRHDAKGRVCDGPGKDISKPAITALVMLAYLGNGPAAYRDTYSKAFDSATRWLLSIQTKDGNFRGINLRNANTEHAIITLALLEAGASTRNTETLDGGSLATAQLVARRAKNGGWAVRTGPMKPSITSTHFGAMAIKAALDFRIIKDRDVAQSTLDFLLDATRKDGTLPAPRSTEKWRASSDANLAMGAVTRFFLDCDPKQDRDFASSLRQILGRVPTGKAVDTDILFTWTGAQASYQAGGRFWTTWAGRVMPQLTKSQRQDGNFTGSWNPVGHDAKAGGRVYQTALSVLTIQTYYRCTRLVR